LGIPEFNHSELVPRARNPFTPAKPANFVDFDRWAQMVGFASSGCPLERRTITEHETEVASVPLAPDMTDRAYHERLPVQEGSDVLLRRSPQHEDK
jgi:hypothetical protein